MSDLVSKFKTTSMEHIVKLAVPVLDEGRSVKFTVVGNSMYPIFRSDVERVTVKKVDIIKKYDVILYRRDSGDYVLHRVIGRGKTGYKLCGDNQLVVEYPVRDDAVIAVMTSFERNGKEVSSDCLWYKMYSFIWCLFIPLRPFIFKTAYTLKKLFTRRK
ncbi:MAG: hypothetical protein UH854_03065 [Clostridia bacterium]|nr:hypothetical protein [Clostridia bacterium]